jgi:hypothetical protein
VNNEKSMINDADVAEDPMGDNARSIINDTDEPMRDNAAARATIDRADIQQDSPQEAVSEPEDPMGDDDLDGPAVPAAAPATTVQFKPGS